MLLRNALTLAVGTALLATGSQVLAQEKPRPYVSVTGGAILSDSDRDTENGPYGGIGLGIYATTDLSFELQLDYSDRDFDSPRTDSLEQLGIGVYGRYFFGEPDGVRPYVVLGVGQLNSESDFSDNGDAMVSAGVGIQGMFNERVHWRTEGRYRYDTDDNSIPGEDDFDDWLISASLMFPFGAPKAAPQPAPRPTPAAAPAPQPAPEPSGPQDSDMDGVIDARDRCPGTAPGTVVNTDGCPTDVTIDLPGVQFEFDSDNIRGGSEAVLADAVRILQRNPEIKVEVAGHTDSIGADSYNRSLSETRARVVYDYLVSNGISADRLT